MVSTVEIAQLLQISRQRVDKLAHAEGFPRPIATLAIGRVWRRDDIIAWAIRTGRLSSAPTTAPTAD